MVTTVNTTFTGPDRAGRYVALTDRYVISVIPDDGTDTDPLPQHPYLTATTSVENRTDPELPRLTEKLRLLPSDVRYAERGTHPKADQLGDDIRARLEAADLAVAREILPLLAGLVDGDLDAAARDAFYSDLAGCVDCGCCAGVSLPGLTVGGRTFGVFVNPRPGTTN